MKTTVHIRSAERAGRNVSRSGVIGAILAVFLVSAWAFAQETPQKTGVSPEGQQQIKALTEKMMLAAMAGKHAEALAAVDKLIALDPANGDYYMGRGEMLRSLGRKEEALAAYDKAAAQSKNPIVRGDARMGRVEILFQQGKYDEAIASCSKSIELDPKDPRLWYQRATARALTGDAVNALADLKKSIELKPDCKKQATKDSAFKALYDNAEFKDLTR